MSGRTPKRSKRRGEVVAWTMLKADGTVEIRFPVDRAHRPVQHALRALLPGAALASVGDVSVVVMGVVLERAVAILEAYCDRIEVLEPEVPPSPPTGGGGEGDSVLPELSGLSPELRKSAYRALAKVFHPDAGGNDAAFKQLQEWWESTEAGS